MPFQSFVICLFFSVFSMTSHASEDYPAVFETSLGPISTVEQYKNRVNELYPTYTHEHEVGSVVEYKGSSIEAMVFLTEGELSDDKHTQRLTYGQISPGLWKLVRLEAESCIRQTVTINGDTNEKWICEDIWYPIAGAFGDIFLVDSADLNMSILSEAIGKEVSEYSPDESDEEVLMTLSEVKALVLEKGANWVEEEGVWNGFSGQGPNQPAISITVSGEPSETIKFSQTFLYFYQEDQMTLGSIDGEVCEYVDRVEDYICKDAFHPTEFAPLPFNLALGSSSQTGDVSSELPIENEEEIQEDLKLSCGALDQSYSSLLRFHFERGLFEVYEVDGYRTAVSNIVDVLDPEGLLVSERQKETFKRINQPPYLFSPQVDELANAIRLGSQGECGVLVDLTEDLFLDLQDNSRKIEDFLSKTRRAGHNSGAVLTDSFDVQLWSWILDKASDLSFFTTSQSAAIDIALGELSLYVSSSLEMSEDLELLMTAAFFKQDAYSRLIKEREFTSLMASQNSQGPYFGVQIIKGLVGHYVLSVHPETKKNYGLEPGDEIVQVRGVDAGLLSSEEMDQFLVNTDEPLTVHVQRGGELTIKSVEATYLDWVQMSYSLKASQNKRVYVLQLNRFAIGLVDRLVQVLKPLVDQNKIDGLVIDISNNVGGDTEEARRFLSMFIDRGPLFHLKIGSRGTAKRPDAYAPSPEYFVSSNLPLAVIASDKTKSAAEVVASSLKVHKRAMLIGGRTFGKFVGQRVFPVSLSDMRQVGLNVTIAEFFDAEGKALNGVGVEPHIQTMNSRLTFGDGNSPAVDISDLPTLESSSNYLSTLDLEALNAMVGSGLSNSQVVEFALKAIDQSQKDDSILSEGIRIVGHID